MEKQTKPTMFFRWTMGNKIMGLVFLSLGCLKEMQRSPVAYWIKKLKALKNGLV
jgi:hypothetical protein